MNNDPVLNSMKDKRPDAKPDANPFSKPPVNVPGVSSKPPEPPKSAVPKEPLSLPKPMKPLHEERAKSPRGGMTGLNVALHLITLFLLLIGLTAMYVKLGGFESDAAAKAEAVERTVDELNAKLDLTIQKIQEEDAATLELKQKLFDAGASLQTCADELATEGEKIKADGTALKTEGETQGNQGKIDLGQNQSDRGSAMSEHGSAYQSQAASYQTDSGIESL
jgi:hypothetical protein